MKQLRTPRLFGLSIVILLTSLLTIGGTLPADDDPPNAGGNGAEKPKDNATSKQPKPKPGKDGSKQAEVQSAKPKITAALVGGRVFTMTSKGVLENATVLIAGEKIAAIGTDLEVPEGTQKIDVSGLIVAPGLIDCRSSLWLSSDSVTTSASDGSLNAADGVDPFSDSWIEVARQGVTAVSVQPRGSLGGQSIILRVAPGESVSNLLIKDGAAMQASLGLSGSTGNSRDRYAQYEALKKTLTAAKAYQEEWEKYEAAVKKAAEKSPSSAKPADGDKKTESTPDKTQRPAGGERPGGIRRPGGGRPSGGRPGTGRPPASGPPSTSAPAAKSAGANASKDADAKKPSTPKKPKRDPVKDVLVKVLKKELPLRMEVHRADDVANAFRLAEDFELTFVFEGISQAGRSWETLKEQHPPLVVGPFASFEATPAYASRKDDRYDDLASVDGLIAIATFSQDPRGSRLIRFHAAEAVSAGLDVDHALRAVTIDAARVLGIDDETGSLEADKFADLMVVAGDPLNPAAPVMLTMSHGEIVYQATDELQAANNSMESSDLVDVPELPSSLPTEFAIVSQRVLRPNGALSPAAIQVKAGRIVGVQADTKATGDLPVFDMGTAVVSPGLVVGHLVDSDVDSREAVASQIRAIDSFSPDSGTLRQLGHGGFTSVMLAPGSRSVVAGQIGCVRFLAQEPILLNEGQPVLPASKFVLASGARSTDRFPASLLGQRELLSQYFDGRAVASNLYVPESVRQLLEAEQQRLLAALKDKSTVSVFEANSDPEIAASVALIRDFGLQAMVLHPEDPQSFIEPLKELQAGLIVRTRRIADHDWYARDIAAASNAGIPVVVSGADAKSIRQTLAVFANAGMSQAAALRAITSEAAESFGLDDVGKLAVGGLADIVVWNGSPLNMSASPVHVIVDGRIQEDAQ